MNISAQRHAGDIKVPELCKDGQSILTTQTGTCSNASCDILCQL